MSLHEWSLAVCTLLADHGLMPERSPVRELRYQWYTAYLRGVTPEQTVDQIVALLRMRSGA